MKYGANKTLFLFLCIGSLSQQGYGMGRPQLPNNEKPAAEQLITDYLKKQRLPDVDAINQYLESLREQLSVGDKDNLFVQAVNGFTSTVTPDMRKRIAFTPLLLGRVPKIHLTI